MNVKDAVKSGMSYIKDLFEQENISNLGLEEVTFEPGNKVWVVTVGFSRAWDYPKPNVLTMVSNVNLAPNRVYKVLRIDDESGEVMSVTNRD